jgi:hypothetical protein
VSSGGKIYREWPAITRTGSKPRLGRQFASEEAAMLRQSDLFRLSAKLKIIMRIV